jgi:hypothetical protein
MSKWYLAVSVLAFGVSVASSQPHAALRSGGSSMPTVTGNGPSQPCRYCDAYRMPGRPGPVFLNPQPLPPGIVANDRMLRH